MKLFRTIHINKNNVDHKSIQEKFEDFHNANPHIYKELVRMARQAKDNGRKKIGIGMLVEIIRWNSGNTTDGDMFKIPNSYRSRYARKIMDNHKELEGIFNISKIRHE